jgi:hypothetical protein
LAGETCIMLRVASRSRSRPHRYGDLVDAVLPVCLSIAERGIAFRDLLGGDSSNERRARQTTKS